MTITQTGTPPRLETLSAKDQKLLATAKRLVSPFEGPQVGLITWDTMVHHNWKGIAELYYGDDGTRNVERVWGGKR